MTPARLVVSSAAQSHEGQEQLFGPKGLLLLPLPASIASHVRPRFGARADGIRVLQIKRNGLLVTLLAK